MRSSLSAWGESPGAPTQHPTPTAGAGAVHTHTHPPAPPSPAREPSWEDAALSGAGEGSGRAGDACGEKQGSTVWSWGQNSYGELGHGDTVERDTPAAVAACEGQGVKHLVAGNEHSVVVTGEGVVLSCGYNDSGQCGLGTTTRVSGLTELPGFRAATIHSANGCEHLAAVTDDNRLFTCGYNARGQLGHGDTGVVMVPRLVDALAAQRVVAVACSYYHTVVSTAGGAVFAFGRNDNGQLGLGHVHDSSSPQLVSGLPVGPVLSLACGQYHTVVSVEAGGVFAFGKNDHGQLGIPSPDNALVPTPMAGALASANVWWLSAGYYHTLALAGGTLFAVGRNDFGQLGLGHTRNVQRPEAVTALGGVDLHVVSCGSFHSLALSTDGTLYAFGRNNHGQLGLGHHDDQSLPQRVDALAGQRVVAVAGGFYHSLALATPHPASPPAAAPGGAAGHDLAEDMRRLLNNPARSDVTFVVENKPIYAHRCIIMVRCEPLAVMLDGTMRESQQEEILLPDQAYAVFLAFLEYLYTNRVAAMEPARMALPFAFDLLSVADQFLVAPLKRLCEAAIEKSITVDNVSVVLKIADARHAATLRARCMEYILNVRWFGRVIGTQGFADLPKHLLSEVLSAASKRGAYLLQ